jgi:hypothetical protein
MPTSNTTRAPPGRCLPHTVGIIGESACCRARHKRHTACTRMLEGGAPFSVVATIMGWSPSTAVRMSRRYGHIGQAAQREAVKALNGAGSEADGAQNWAQFQAARGTAHVD